jgi:uncharacterized protein YbjT (DUF2867 family)/predicted SnoaL-like aldol condensation-catalyzing enzyme
MILVTGASGTVGRAVVDCLRRGDAPFRALYRDEAGARKAPPGVSTAIADFADGPSLERAVSGVDAVYLVCSPVPSLVELESRAIEACARMGVKHVVLNSALGAADWPESFPSWHRTVEDELKRSGLGYTILRPNGFLQNIVAYMAPSIRAQGAFYAAMGDARTSYLDVRDIADVAVKALTHPGDHAGRVYELNGPEAVTNAELAARISGAIGREVKYVDLSEAAHRDAMLALGMPGWQVDALLGLQRYYRSGRGGEVTDVLPHLLGRAPLSLDRYLAEHRDKFGDPVAAPAARIEASAGATPPETGMSLAEMKQFVRDHFEEFVNRKNLSIADVNFAPGFRDHGSDVPAGMPPGGAGAKQYLAGAFQKFPDISVEILDMIAEGDRVVVRNRWTGTEARTQTRHEFSGIVIWRIANRQLVERWAYLTPPRPSET